MTLVAGVDLGKTSCRVRLVRDGYPIGTVEVPGARGLADPGGADAARAAITAGLVRLSPPGEVDVLVVGAAGREAAGPELEHQLAGLARELVLTSDAITSHAGAFGGGEGAMVAIGTGAVGIGLGPEGLVRVDGLGYWLGDDGGGAWIGRLALRTVLDARAGGPATSLLAAAEARYGDLARLPATLAAGDRVAATTAAFTPDVVAAAEAGDAMAVRVLDAAGAALAQTLGNTAALSGADRATAVGGLASVPLLMERLRGHLPEGLAWVEPKGTSLDGAVLLAEPHDLPHEGEVRRLRHAVSGGDVVDALATEQVRRDLDDLDERSPEQLVDLLLAAEATVPAAVAAERHGIAAAVGLAEQALLAGGRLIYVGAGTPGRLAALDAAEIPPTYGTDPERVVAVLAGGPAASGRAVEGAEDSAEAGRADLLVLTPGPTTSWSASRRRAGRRTSWRPCGSLARAEPPRSPSSTTLAAPRRRRRRRHRAADRSGGPRRVDPAEGGHRAEGGPQRALDRRHGAHGQELRRVDGRRPGFQPQAPAARRPHDAGSDRSLRYRRARGPRGRRPAPEDRARRAPHGCGVGSAARALDAAGGRARVAVTQLGQRLDGAG